jgi:hypothetical protein
VGLRTAVRNSEFKDVKPLAFHVHGDGVFHMTGKPVTAWPT